MTNLSHTASFHSNEKIAPSNRGIKHLEQPTHSFATVDLVAVVGRVLLELSPLAYAAGYEVVFDSDVDVVTVDGDEGAIERAMTNLVQNAIDCGGRKGQISVWIAFNGTISVCDDGGGIPPADRENVFEPFWRAHQGGRGAGLGLDLVQRTMTLHGGYAEAFQGEKSGACFRLIFMPPDLLGSSAGFEQIVDRRCQDFVQSPAH